MAIWRCRFVENRDKETRVLKHSCSFFKHYIKCCVALLDACVIGLMVLLYSTLYFSPKLNETDERHFLVRIRTFEKCVELVYVVFVCVL